MIGVIATVLVIFALSAAVCAWVWLFERGYAERVDIACACGAIQIRDVVVCGPDTTDQVAECVAMLTENCFCCIGVRVALADLRALGLGDCALTTDNFPADHSSPEASHVH